MKMKVLTLMKNNRWLGLGFLAIALNGTLAWRLTRPPVATPPLTNSTANVRSVADWFADLTLDAKAYLVYDVRSGQTLVARNADLALPVASITKVITALVAKDALPAAALVTVDEAALAAEGDSGLHPDERWRFADLLDFTLVGSSNDGAEALAAAAFSVTRKNFTESMNDKARALGLTQTHFLNSTGLDESASSIGGLSSAQDLARLFTYLLKEQPDLLAATGYPQLTTFSLDNIRHLAKNTNPIVSSIPGLLASKTGFTDEANGNLVVAFDRGLNQPVIVVVLGSSYAGRFSDILRLVNRSMQYFGTQS